MGFLKPHNPSEYPSILLYILDETHITVTFTTALAILWTRDAHVVWFAIGALNSSLSAKVLKNLIRSPRPPPPPPTTSKPYTLRPKRTYGMPSTHSTALTFYFSYLLPLIVVPNGLPYPFFLGPLVTSYWIGGLWSRKELGYHTWEQIVGGAAYGTLLAGVWRGVWEHWPVIGKGLQGLIDVTWRTVFG
ncbi:hypothetical protein CI109_107367 [Kwoniella shandongensis]|uniref:Uncharacterized protein n=1 Tax=Kwoniella shandongensis TaxID=1734106 RepID=A0A5M6C148_9TREE|nr:uncharacterized protein CI109_004705 [Kwoniella shandongensis]KAA5526929.1 hypothetical protein CI109_004705 [Kwoniella shandongensis]